MTDGQLALFGDIDDATPPPCIQCDTAITPTPFPATALPPGVRLPPGAKLCNHCHTEIALTYYAKYGRPGSRKHPGMLFPGQRQGDREPTAAQRAAALQLLRESGLTKASG